MRLKMQINDYESLAPGKCGKASMRQSRPNCKIFGQARRPGLTKACRGDSLWSPGSKKFDLHAVRCGKCRDIDKCPQPLFMMFKQNARLRIQVCCPKSGEDKKNDPQKMSGIVLKHFGYPVLTLQKLSGGGKK
jgi:hypothetical protein